MKHKYSLLWMLLLCLVTAGPAWAQFTVNGRVTDATTGETLIGVTILDKDSGKGVVTDNEGKYSIQLPGQNATLTYSYVGYVTRNIPVSASTGELNVQLKQDVANLGEVVVSGLATSVKRANLANDVSTVSANELVGTTTSQTLDASLYGKITGANISSNSGAPGGGISVKLRGVTTINGSSEPLYIVDGIYLNNDAIANGSNAVTAAAAGGSASNQDNPVNRIADLNPDEIESIEVLKGASAAAIYGQRASNGVVIITTKKGTTGEPKFTFSQSLGVTTLRKKLGTRQFTEQTALATFDSLGLQLYRDAVNSGRGFLDYEELLYGQDGLLSTSNLSTSFGNDRTSLYISGMVKSDEGIIKTTGYDKQSIRANVDHRFSNKLKVGVASNYIHSESRRGLTNNDNTGTTFGVSMTATPNFIDLRPNADGIYPDHPFNASNQLQLRDLFTNREDVNRLLTSVKVEYDIFQSTSNILQFKFTGGLDYFGQNNKLIFPRELQFERNSGAPGTLLETKTENLNTNTSALLVHTYLPNDRFSLTSQVGFTSFNNDQNSILTVANDILGSQTNVDQAASVRADQTKLYQRDRGFFVQEEVNYNDTYIVTLGLRGDKSDRNGNVDKFYLYPKASGAWNVTNMPFWKVEDINQLKLRVAFGQTGNVSNFGSKFTTLGTSNIGGLGGILINNQRGVPGIKPERQTEIEGGFDLGLYDGAASFNFTLYRKQITDMLLRRQVEPSTGFSFENFNGGEMVNKGVEMSLNVLPLRSHKFRWDAQINFWKNTSEVTSLPVPAFDVGGFGATLAVYRIEEGKSATQIVGIDPIVLNSGNVDQFPNNEVGDTVITTRKLGDGEPDFQMSFDNQFRLFRNFELSFLWHWKKGGDVINLTELLFDLNGTTGDYDATDLSVSPLRADVAGITSEDVNGVKRVKLLGVSAANYVKDASYLRLREVGLYYNVPTHVLSRWTGDRIHRVRLGVSGTNLITFTPYNSYDPEVSNFGNQPIAQGIEVTPYPSSKQYYFHISVDF